MKVKFLRGDKQQYSRYSIIIPEDKEIEDLPNHIQDSINLLGELRTFYTKDLSNENDDWSLTMKRQIQETGASLSKIGYNRWPSGIYYTFPPFSKLNEVEHN